MFFLQIIEKTNILKKQKNCEKCPEKEKIIE